jgi:hypothetical protein
MAASIMSLLAFLLPLIVQGLQAWADEKKGGNADANIQNNRKALSKNNTALLSAQYADQHDRVLSALRGRKR